MQIYAMVRRECMRQGVDVTDRGRTPYCSWFLQNIEDLRMEHKARAYLYSRCKQSSVDKTNC